MKYILLPLAMAAAIAATPAMADLYQTFDIAYSGAGFANSATAAGTITLDLTALGATPATVNNFTGSLPNPTPISPYVSSLDLTVSGSTSGGNGTFTLADYNGFIFNFASVDLTTQVVGQPGLSEFNLFSIDSAPTGYDPVVIVDSGGDYLGLTSLEPVTAPEPAQMVSGLALASLGGADLLLKLRRRK